jgi:alpha 1,2-mannosyltransferase
MSSLSSLKEHLQPGQNSTAVYGQQGISNFAADSETTMERRANATFVFLARNNDLEGVVDTIRQMEDRFNHKYQYPWVLLNEVPFTNDFKRSASLMG